MIDFATAYPNSRKVHDERTARVTADGPDITLRIPLREVTLGGGELPVRLYDTSGPQGHDVRSGLPKLRADWIAARRRSGFVGTQLYYARRGEITPEMEFVAAREGLPADFVREEIARCRAIIDRQKHPRDARVDHPERGGADRHGADLSGTRKSRWPSRRSHMGNLPRHACRAV
jgi:hypothetical protein